MTGSLLASKGRKLAIITSDLIGIIGSILCLISMNTKSFIYLLLGRSLNGIAVGFMNTVTLIYLKEISPVELEGNAMYFFFIVRNLSMFVATFMGIFLGDTKVDDNYFAL